MRIAVPVTRGEIAQHPGHCEVFLVAEVKDGAIIEERELANPGHGPLGPPPLFLANEGVTRLLAWGLPEHAREKFAMLGIQVQLGATGEPHQTLRAHLAGTLQYVKDGLDGGEACEGHEHILEPPGKVVDVRTVAPRDRHPLIFRTFEALAPGETFLLVNDHDPKPLYYLFAAEQAGRFTWDYLEQGPEVWRVRVGRKEAPTSPARST